MVLVSVLVSSCALQLGSFGNGPVVGYELVLVIFGVQQQRCLLLYLLRYVAGKEQRRAFMGHEGMPNPRGGFYACYHHFCGGGPCESARADVDQMLNSFTHMYDVKTPHRGCKAAKE